MAIIASISTIAIMNGHNHATKLHGANMDQFFHKEPLPFPSWTLHRLSDRFQLGPEITVGMYNAVRISLFLSKWNTRWPFCDIRWLLGY